MQQMKLRRRRERERESKKKNLKWFLKVQPSCLGRAEQPVAGGERQRVSVKHSKITIYAWNIQNYD